MTRDLLQARIARLEELELELDNEIEETRRLLAQADARATVSRHLDPLLEALFPARVKH